MVRRIQLKNITAKTEYRFRTSNGQKSSRYADVVGLDSQGRVAEIHQVGRNTKRYNAPVARERSAIRDIRHSDDYIRFTDAVRPRTGEVVPTCKNCTSIFKEAFR